MNEDRWIYLEGKRGGHAYTANTREPLDRQRWPEFDHHLQFVLGYTPHWRTGLPKNLDEIKRLQDFEDHLVERLEGAGILVASETTQAKRTMHFYLRGDGPQYEAARGSANQDNGKKGPWVTLTHDPSWEAVAHLVIPPEARAAAAGQA